MAVSRASPLSMSRWWRSDSVIWSPIFMTGFSDVIGSWNTIAISVPQTPRISLGAEADDLGALVAGAAGPVDVAGGEQPHDRAGQDRLARAGLADDAERAAPLEGEAHAVDGAHRARLGEEVGLEVLDGEERRARVDVGAGQDDPAACHQMVASLTSNQRRSWSPA